MSSTSTAPSAFADTRLRQIRRLVALRREHVTEFNALGRDLTGHAIFAMVLDCRAARVHPTALGQALLPAPTASDASR